MDNETYYIDCDCGERVRREIKYLAPGVLAGFVCPVCGAVTLARSPGKRKHRREQTEAIEAQVLSIFKEERPRLTIRHIFYMLASREVIPKSESGYRRTLYHLKHMRRNGAIPYGWLADNTRYRLKPKTHSGLGAALEDMQRYYRRDLWDNANAHVEIWVEKDAVAGVINTITDEYDVPLFVARGYSSDTFIYTTAEEIIEIDKPVYLYHFGDFDPSGRNAALKIHEGLMEHGASHNFEIAAITEQQINDYNLPTRATKKSDPRTKAWGNRPSVEIDALPAPILRQLVESCILRHVDQNELTMLRNIEEAEKETLQEVRENMMWSGMT